MIMASEKDIMVSDYVSNTQSDTIIDIIVKQKPIYKKTSQIRELLKNP